MREFDYEDLFNRCLNAKYIHTNEGGSWDIIHENSTLYLFLQWSNGVSDWRNNFDFPAKPYKDMPHSWKAHRGFVRTWKSIEPCIAHLIMDPAVKEIIIVGYSHGASLAVLAHEFCWFNREDIRDSIYSFGFEGARVFCGKLPAELKERWANFTMIRNGTDIVTHVPPALFGFKHVGTVVQVNPNHDYPYTHGKRPKCIEAHFPDNIIDAIQKYKKSQEAVQNIQ